MVKNLAAMQETWVWSLCWEDPLERGMATHSSILAWKIPWTEKPSGLQSMWWQSLGHNWAINTFTLSLIVKLITLCSKNVIGMWFVFGNLLRCALLYFLFIYFLPHHLACGILILCPGITTDPPAVEAQINNLWIAREVPWLISVPVS